MLSSNPRETEYVRKALLGNSFICPVVAWLLGHLLYDNSLITRRPTLTELSLGIPLRFATVAPEASVKPAEGPAEPPLGAVRVDPETPLVKRIAGLCDHRGSDVGIGLDVPLNPSVWLRAETPARWWLWRTAIAFRWNAKEHINTLGLRAALATLCWRVRQRRFLGRRVLHLLDSSVVIGVLTKRRSANRTLGMLVRRANSLELASGVHAL